MPILRLYKAIENRARIVLTTTALSLLAGLFLPSATETAEANGDTRTISLYHAHRHESIEVTFRKDGYYDSAALEKLNYFLRDWRNDEETKMDPRLFDVVWEVYRAAGADEPITVLSAYRSPETNAMLRRRSRAVAEHSQHMLGKAMDTTMPEMSMEKIREIGMRMQRGGVGYYPSSNFVHLDVGNVRHWPRMNYDQLVRLFPDGKTVHIPSNGQPLARYEEARAEIEANGGTAIALADTQPKSKGFFAWLFGSGNSGGEDDAEEVASASKAHVTRTASRGGRSAPGEAGATAFVASAAAPASQTLAERYGAAHPTQDTAPVAAPVASQQVSSQQVASLSAQTVPIPKPREPADDTSTASDDAAPFGAITPIPPRRPTELRASELMAMDEVPLPPVRPGQLLTMASMGANEATASIANESWKLAGKKNEPAKNDMAQNNAAPAPVPPKPDVIANMILRSTPEPAPQDRAPLPAFITHGPERVTVTPAQMLAYAAPVAPLPARSSVTSDVDAAPTAPIPALRTAVLSRTNTAPLRGAAANRHAPIVSARLDGSNFRSLTSDVSETQAPTQSVLGPTPYGLRAAAQVKSGTLSDHPSANYVTHFAATATELETAHFTGRSVASLPTAAEELRQVAAASQLR